MVHNRGLSRGHIMLTGVLAVCLLAGAPAANAVFTSSVNAGPMSVGTLRLASPAGNNVTASCTPTGSSGKYKLNVTVNSYGTVPRANSYVLTVTAPGGGVTTTDLSVSKTYTTSNAVAGAWTYSIDARYLVPNSTNIWQSAANPVTLTC